MKNKNGEIHHAGADRRISHTDADEIKAMLPLPTPSPTSAARTRLRHAAITDTLGRYRSYESWANRVRGVWK